MMKYIKLENELEITNWNEIKIKLKKKFPSLNEADLQWRYTTQEDLLSTIANNLGKTRKELMGVINLA